MTSPGWLAEGRPLLAGRADGLALVLDEPLSFWGGVDAMSGLIVDAHHPQHGRHIGGRVLVLSSGRGSSSSSSVLAECLGAGSGPAAILLGRPDPILVLGALVAHELGKAMCPVVVIGEARSRVVDGDHISIDEQGVIRVTPRG